MENTVATLADIQSCGIYDLVGYFGYYDAMIAFITGTVVLLMWLSWICGDSRREHKRILVKLANQREMDLKEQEHRHTLERWGACTEEENEGGEEDGRVSN